jgi:hypothetical protein
MPQLCLPFGKYNITLAQAKISPPTAISFAISEFHSFNCLCNFKRTFLFGTHRAAGTSLLPKAKTSHHRFCVQDSFVFSPRKNRPRFGRFFVVWIYCFLLNYALLILVVFTEQCFVDIIAFC